MIMIIQGDCNDDGNHNHDNNTHDNYFNYDDNYTDKVDYYYEIHNYDNYILYISSTPSSIPCYTFTPYLTSYYHTPVPYTSTSISYTLYLAHTMISTPLP